MYTHFLGRKVVLSIPAAPGNRKFRAIVKGREENEVTEGHIVGSRQTGLVLSFAVSSYLLQRASRQDISETRDKQGAERRASSIIGTLVKVKMGEIPKQAHRIQVHLQSLHLAN